MGLPRSLAGWTIAVFGLLAVLLGAVGVIWPEALLRMLGIAVTPSGQRTAGDHTLTFLVASSMASFNMGVYYLLAAAQDWHRFFQFTVVFRAVTVTVFLLLVLVGPAPDRFAGVALWEGLGALATGIALRLDRRHTAGTRPVPDAAR